MTPRYIDPGITTFYFDTFATQQHRMMRKLEPSSLDTEQQIRCFTYRPGQCGLSGARPMDPAQVVHLAHTLVGEESEFRLECLVFEPPDMLGSAHTNIELVQIFPNSRHH